MNQPIIDMIDDPDIFAAPEPHGLRTARYWIARISLRAWIGGIGTCAMFAAAYIMGGS